MTREQVFAVWAPAASAWSTWAKPVLFAHLDGPPATADAAGSAAPPASSPPSPPSPLLWVPPADGATVLVLDVPGPAGAWLAVAVAAGHGYRPVPLYNAVPWPAGAGRGAATASVCDLGPLADAVVAATPLLAAAADRLPPNAPPAFLLDADRRTGSGPPAPGRFDNRSLSLPTDFPSANLLLSRGVCRAVLVQPAGREPQPDLAHTLLRWQQAGVAIEAVAPDAAGPPVPITVRRPPYYRLFFQRLLATVGLRRHPLGGFGGLLPDPSAAGG